MSVYKKSADVQIKQESKKDYTYLIPLAFVLPIAVLSVIMIVGGLHYETGGHHLSFIAEGGVFAFNNLKIFGIPIYGFLIGVGCIMAVTIAVLRRKRLGFSFIGSILVTVIFVLVSLVLGSKLFAGIEFVINSGDWSDFALNGFSLFGGLYFSLIILPLMALILRKNLWEFADFLAPSYCVLLLFTRLGCFFVGCCGARWKPINGVYIRLPVQLFEILGVLLILSSCLWLESRNFMCGGKHIGSYPVSLLAYCVLRFFLEDLRAKTHTIAGLTLSQIYCMIFVAIGIVIIVLSDKNYKRNKGNKPITDKKGKGGKV